MLPVSRSGGTVLDGSWRSEPCLDAPGVYRVHAGQANRLLLCPRSARPPSDLLWWLCPRWRCHEPAGGAHTVGHSGLDLSDRKRRPADATRILGRLLRPDPGSHAVLWWAIRPKLSRFHVLRRDLELVA